MRGRHWSAVGSRRSLASRKTRHTREFELALSDATMDLLPLCERLNTNDRRLTTTS